MLVLVLGLGLGLELGLGLHAVHRAAAVSGV